MLKIAPPWRTLGWAKTLCFFDQNRLAGRFLGPPGPLPGRAKMLQNPTPPVLKNRDFLENRAPGCFERPKRQKIDPRRPTTDPRGQEGPQEAPKRATDTAKTGPRPAKTRKLAKTSRIYGRIWRALRGSCAPGRSGTVRGGGYWRDARRR